MKTLIFISIMLLNILDAHLGQAEAVLAEGDISFLSCQKIYDSNFLLYSKNSGSFGRIFVKEFNLDWEQRREKQLGINGASAHLAYFNNKFYVFYTSLEKDGKARIAEFDMEFNLQRDTQLNPALSGGEWAYQLINIDDSSLYLLYARNWGNDCGFKIAKLNRDIETIERVDLINGSINFHLYASEFASAVVNGRLYVAYKGSDLSEGKNIFSDTHPPENMSIFVDEYIFEAEPIVINRRCIDKGEKLWPALSFDIDRFYLTYDGYDHEAGKSVIYVNQYDREWNPLKHTKLILNQLSMPTPKTIISYEDKCYVVALSPVSRGDSAIFLKEINFDLKEQRLTQDKGE